MSATQPGTLHYLSMNVMFTCSVSTVLFSGDPLLRYDARCIGWAGSSTFLGD